MEGMIQVFIGKLAVTRNIQRLIDSKEIEYEQLWECVSRYINHDWGLTDKHDCAINEQSLDRNYGTVLAEYKINDIRIWISTSIGDSETTWTTILLPEEW